MRGVLRVLKHDTRIVSGAGRSGVWIFPKDESRFKMTFITESQLLHLCSYKMSSGEI